MARAEQDFAVSRLGETTIRSPLRDVRFVRDDDRILLSDRVERVRASWQAGEEPPSFELAGPRETIFFDPDDLRCGIVTCGGLCPGLNDVVRAIVLSLYDHYGVWDVYGFRYGYEGLVRSYGHTPSGSPRRTSAGSTNRAGPCSEPPAARSPPPRWSTRSSGWASGCCSPSVATAPCGGAHAIAEEVGRRGLPIGVIGVPKTIDNDISYIVTSFGFETAVAAARQATRAAYIEATSARNGVGLVKLMGRDSGYIASYTALADTTSPSA